MKLKSVEFIDCSIFGSVKFDFTDEKGRAVDTILIAGENGLGKTMLLETILYHKIPVKEEGVNQEIEFKYELLRSEAEKIVDSSTKQLLDDVNTFVITVKSQSKGKHSSDSKGKHSSDSIKIAIEGKNILFTNSFSSFEKFNQLRPIFYLPAEINFKPAPITTITDQDIDAGLTTREIKDGNIATLLRQILVNIEALDAIDFTKWAKRAHRNDVDYSKIDRRMRRFEWAFSYMFPRKKFKEIKTENGEKKILFEENGQIMDIDQLSSGEKQIVFRGGYVLQNLGRLHDSLFLMDEPEISLHPDWQLKIVDFYKNIFSDGNGNQTSQIFVTTHSPFILHNYLRKNDRVIIIKRDETGSVRLNKKDSFFGWTNEKIVEEAFNIKLAPVERGIIFVEGETDELYINKAIEIHADSPYPFEIKWVGRVDKSGNVQFTGDTALNQLYAFMLSNPGFIKAPVILLYDSDTKKNCERRGNLIIEILPFIVGKKYKKGIENLLQLSDNFDYQKFYSESKKTDDYGATSTIVKLEKKKLCTYICENGTDNTSELSEIYKFMQDLKGKILLK